MVIFFRLVVAKSTAIVNWSLAVCFLSHASPVVAAVTLCTSVGLLFWTGDAIVAPGGCAYLLLSRQALLLGQGQQARSSILSRTSSPFFTAGCFIDGLRLFPCCKLLLLLMVLRLGLLVDKIGHHATLSLDVYVAALLY